MHLPISNADAVQSTEPTAHTSNSNVAAEAHKSVGSAVDRDLDLAQFAHLETDQPPLPEIDQAALLDRVKQTIDDLESQGLLMLFDRHDRVAERLADDLIAASSLQKDLAVET